MFLLSIALQREEERCIFCPLSVRERFSL